jgi:hypothetical protein
MLLSIYLWVIDPNSIVSRWNNPGHDALECCAIYECEWWYGSTDIKVHQPGGLPDLVWNEKPIPKPDTNEISRLWWSPPL